jgi:pyruvate ferredoxin oxidoreductase delta subunit
VKNKEFSAQSIPVVGEAGNTGEWRLKVPVVDSEKCLAAKQKKMICQICWGFCPEAAINKGTPPTINLDFCKGCGICSEECPGKAIKMMNN